MEFWEDLLWLSFLPISCLYWLGVQTRNGLYSVGWKTTQTLNQFVVSIGNLTVGGTGKTPTVVWVAQELQKRGFKIAVLSRGYNRKSNQPLVLTANFPGNVDDFGDEPAMMARLFGLTVAVSNPRYKGALETIKNQSCGRFYPGRRLSTPATGEGCRSCTFGRRFNRLGSSVWSLS